MYLMTTTLGLDPMAAIRREGVLRLLGLEREPVLFLNCSQFKNHYGSFDAAWTVEREMPSLEMLTGDGGIIVESEGTASPSFGDVLHHALNRELPLYFVGVSSSGGDHLRNPLRSAHGLVRGATVGSNAAREWFGRSDIDAPIFTDPVLQAGIPTRARDLDLVVFYRGHGGLHDNHWRRFARRHGSSLSRVILGSPRDYSSARMLFGDRVFFSSEPESVKEQLARTRVLVTAESDAVLPVLSSGGTVFQMPHRNAAASTLGLSALGESLVPIGWSSLSKRPDFDVRDSRIMVRNLRKLAATHVRYWRDRSARAGVSPLAG